MDEYSLRTWEAERVRVEGYPLLQTKFEAILEYIRPSLKKNVVSQEIKNKQTRNSHCFLVNREKRSEILCSLCSLP